MTAQHMVALERANQIRLERAAIRRRLKAGELTIAEVLADRPGCIDSMRALELIRSLDRYGHKRAARLLQAAEVPLTRTVGRLTERQRQSIVATLAARRGRAR